jgi:rhamnopyranosyl-N-acetylglucosaminyl-diphospho-decaprenol beta-1,3/1,4-galactofuranosyltransferase
LNPTAQRILAVVVTHNRCALLARCLHYIQHQVRRPDGIVVINNGSNDNTEEMLRTQGVRCITQGNLGSAGGWHRGIQCALEERFDAVWLMDDDGFPEESALNRLEAHFATNVACVSSVVLCEEDRRRLVFPLPRLDAYGLPVLFSAKRKLRTLDEVMPLSEGDRYPFAHFFNGALISTSSIREVGNVDRDFFIFGEELDYMYRLKSAGPVYTVLSAHHYHPDVTGRPLTDVKTYYYIKNTLILNQRYMDWVPLRNLLTVAAGLVRTGLRNGWAEALSFVAGAKRKILWTAIGRGLRRQLAKDFDG